MYLSSILSEGNYITLKVSDFSPNESESVRIFCQIRNYCVILRGIGCVPVQLYLLNRSRITTSKKQNEQKEHTLVCALAQIQPIVCSVCGEPESVWRKSALLSFIYDDRAVHQRKGNIAKQL